MRRRVSNKSHEKYRVYLSLLLKFTRNSTCELSFPLDSMNPCHDFADTVVAKMCPRRSFQQESQSE